MTNEELAVLIQNGEKELIPQLWEQVGKYLRFRAEKFHESNKTACLSAGVEADDLFQVSYFAFQRALRYFKEDSGYKFLTFMNLPLRSEYNKLLDRKRWHHVPLNNCLRFDLGAIEDGCDENASLFNVIADESALEFVDDVETGSVNDMLYKVLDSLPDTQKRVLELTYLKGYNMQKTGDEMGMSRERVRQIRNKALEAMRREWQRCERV